MNVTAVVLALGAAGFYALAATLQHRQARREAVHATLDPRLLLRLLRRPMWLAGGAADLAGAGLHATALAFGPLALVQPILVSGLIIAILLEAALDRRRPTGQDLVAAGLSAAGLATFIAVAAPRAGDVDPASADLVDETIGVGTLVAVLLLFAWRSSGPRRGTLLGIATGAIYAFAAALAKACVARFGSDPAGLFADWRLYAVIVVGLAGVVLNQNAFQTGPIAGPLTGITLTDPLVSLVLGVVAFQEGLSTGGVRLLVELLAVVAMAYGIWLVSRVWSAHAAP